MIPGLAVDEETERRVWRAFATWAEHFKRDLAASGIDGLVARYRDLVHSASTESCGHGPNGSRLTGDSWRSCCGISYEYLNDISVRTALGCIIALAPGESTDGLRRETEMLDAQLRSLIDTPDAEDPWWLSLPRTVER